MAEPGMPPFAPGRTGNPHGPAGLLVREGRGLAIVALQVRQGGQLGLAQALEREFGATLPAQPVAVRAGTVCVLWAGPGRWLFLAPGEGPEWEEHLRAALGAHAAVCDQSDGRVLLELSGPSVLPSLEKGVRVDLHPAAFAPGAVILTAVSHIGVQLWRDPADGGCRVLVPRSYFGSFWSWLGASAAEFGCEVQA